jgi:hypothetical protein
LTTFPDASTTGVPPGTSLNTVNGNFASSHAGQIIDAHDVNGTITVDHPGVIIRNSQAQYITVNADNVTIEDTTVTGQNIGGSGINLLANNATVQRVDISGVENGIWMEASDSLIEDNYIHDLRNDTYHDPHYDGLQIPGMGANVSNNLITHNNFDLGPGTSSSITMADATNIDITNNRLHGGTYNIYFEGNTTGSDVANNVFAAYQFGEVAGATHASQTYSGNVSGDTAVPDSTASATAAGTSAPLAEPVAPPTTPTVAAPTTDTRWSGTDDTFAFAPNFGRDVASVPPAYFGADVITDSRSSGSGDHAMAGKTAFDALAADLAHATRESQNAQDVGTDDGRPVDLLDMTR